MMTMKIRRAASYLILAVFYLAAFQTAQAGVEETLAELNGKPSEEREKRRHADVLCRHESSRYTGSRCGIQQAVSFYQGGVFQSRRAGRPQQSFYGISRRRLPGGRGHLDGDLRSRTDRQESFSLVSKPDAALSAQGFC